MVTGCVNDLYVFPDGQFHIVKGPPSVTAPAAFGTAPGCCLGIPNNGGGGGAGAPAAPEAPAAPADTTGTDKAAATASSVSLPARCRFRRDLASDGMARVVRFM